jgi:hypothetical protein
MRMAEVTKNLIQIMDQVKVRVERIAMKRLLCHTGTHTRGKESVHESD